MPLRALVARSGYLRTRFARRTLLTFLGAALLPSAVATGLWYQRLRTALVERADQGLAEQSKAASVALLERLDLLVSRVQPVRPEPTRSSQRLVVEGRERSAEGGLVLAVRDGGGGERRVVLESAQLWTALDQLLAGDDGGYCVFAMAPTRRLHCAGGAPVALIDTAMVAATNGSRVAILRQDGWRAATRELFLRSIYQSPPWRVVVMQSEAPIAARLSEDMRYLFFVGLLALVSAFALSHIQLRRQTAPIEILQKATRAIREGDLDTRVSLASGDEFTEFGDTFNAMTHTLQQQFSLLGDFDALNERALRANSQSDLLHEALARLGERVSAAVVGVVLIDTDAGDHVQYLTRVGGRLPLPRGSQAPPRGATRTGTGVLTPAARALLRFGAPDVHRSPRTDRQLASLLDPAVDAWRSDGVADVLVLPLRHDQDLMGAVLLGLAPHVTRDPQELEAERRLVERLALGLANARLVARLDALSLGTLRAFGSTIDANSRWTAGHSERVTRVAEQLAIELQIPESDRLTLTRGCLLHDIGKVGVPAAILDKNGRLTDDEFAIMQRHPVIGAEILSAIPGFRELLPVVRSHHERLDGLGYPDGLRGDEIPTLVRIASVADVFDALASARPYRDGLPLPMVRRIIADGRGTQFDPRIVDALDSMLAEDRLVVPSLAGGSVRDRLTDHGPPVPEPMTESTSEAIHLFPVVGV